MPLKTILFVTLFVAACAGALQSPIWGVLGYVGHYCIGPERQWWHAPVRPLGIRYSFTLAGLTAVGMVLHWHKLRFGNRFLHKHEILMLLFLVAVWVTTVLGPQTVGRYTIAGIDHPSVKFTKVLIFVLMLTHVATTRQNVDRLVWVFVLCAIVLGMQAWSTPYRSFSGGRLERVGGPDFAESNFFSAFMAGMLWIIGCQFLRSRIRGKVLCFIAAGYGANAIILTRSRGAMVGLVGGALMALATAPKRYRALILAGVIVAGSGFLYLTDAQFLERISTIFAEEEERDASAQSRIELAKAGMQMFVDHPLGVGPGNFYQNIGDYIPSYAGKDAHNTFVRCLTETGILGFPVFLLILANALVITFKAPAAARVLPEAERADVGLLAFGLRCGLASVLTCCLTVSLTYVEFLWWFLMLPVCLQRVVDNMIEDQEAELLVDDVYSVGGKRVA